MQLSPGSPVLSLYHKAKALIWDPADIALDADIADWARLTARERDILIRLSHMFLGGETAVAGDLAPLLIALRRMGGPLEEQMFVATQLFEEAKHVEWFDRWAREIAPEAPAPDPGPAYRTLFDEALPNALNRLLTDASPDAHAGALVTYHMIVEGVLAETGYRGFMTALKANGLMPGTTRAVELVQRDEARHIAYGLHALSRILSAEPRLWEPVEERLSALLELCLAIIGDTFAPYGDDIPFGMDPTEFVTFAGDQFARRIEALERSRPQALHNPDRE